MFRTLKGSIISLPVISFYKKKVFSSSFDIPYRVGGFCPAYLKLIWIKYMFLILANILFIEQKTICIKLKF